MTQESVNYSDALAPVKAAVRRLVKESIML